MRAAEQGFLLLTGHLGDVQCKPLTVPQFRTLTERIRSSERRQEKQELEADDLIALGYNREMAERILLLLSRQEQLECYVNLGRKSDCYPITRISSTYPQVLRKKLGADCPVCLWAKGDLTLLERPAVSLVGSRQLQPDNRAFAKEAGRQAAIQGYTLISGNARGADRAAQESCLEHGGQVIAIVPDSLAEQKAIPHVLYLSEDGFDEEFSASRALSRNRLIHAMGEMTFVAGSTYNKGGSWSGAVHNLRHRLSPLYGFQDNSEGMKALYQMGAMAIDIFDLQDFSKLPKNEPSLFD